MIQLVTLKPRPDLRAPIHTTLEHDHGIYVEANIWLRRALA